jgi:hypothetical protein
MRKYISQLCLCLKEANLVQKYSQLCQLCLGSELFQFMRKVIPQLCQLCLCLKEAKLVQKYPQLCQLCQLCLGYDICPLWEKLYLNFANFANFAFLLPLLKTCQLCLTLPNFAQLCPTMHFSHSRVVVHTNVYCNNCQRTSNEM